MGILADAEIIRNHPLWKFYCDSESLDGNNYQEDIEIATYYVSLILKRKMDYHARMMAIKMLAEFFPFSMPLEERPSIKDFYHWRELKNNNGKYIW